MGSGRDDDRRVLMEATLVPPAERLPSVEAPRRERRRPEQTEGARRRLSLEPERL